MISHFLETLVGLVLKGIEYFLTGMMCVFYIALLITPIILTFFANGQVQTVGLVLFLIETLISIGLLVENANK